MARFRDHRVTMEKDRPPDLRVIQQMVSAMDAGVNGTTRLVRPDNKRHPDLMRKQPNRAQRRKMQRDYQARVRAAQKEAAAEAAADAAAAAETVETFQRSGSVSRSLTELAELAPIEAVNQ